MSRRNTETNCSFSWVKRDYDLKKVKRYHKFKVMFYRTDLLTHSRRVQGIVGGLLPEAISIYPGLDGKLALLISKFHDDFEMVSERGDVPLQLKLLMNGSELSILKQEEIAAAEYLSKAYGNPRVGGYLYKDLLMHSILKDCPEAQLHSFADKIDGYCEALHEIFAGNLCFLEPVINYQAKTFNNLLDHFPLISRVFAEGNGFFHFPVIELASYFYTGQTSSVARLHTPTGVIIPTGITHYDLWRKVTLALPSGMELLTEQKEFYLS